MNYRLACITGATSGLGQALCYLLAEKKIPLFLTARDANALSLLQKDLLLKTHTEILQADLSDTKDLALLQKAAEKTMPRQRCRGRTS